MRVRLSRCSEAKTEGMLLSFMDYFSRFVTVRVCVCLSVLTPAIVLLLITCQRGAWELLATCVLGVKTMVVFMNEWMDLSMDGSIDGKMENVSIAHLFLLCFIFDSSPIPISLFLLLMLSSFWFYSILLPHHLPPI